AATPREGPSDTLTNFNFDGPPDQLFATAAPVGDQTVVVQSASDSLPKTPRAPKVSVLRRNPLRSVRKINCVNSGLINDGSNLLSKPSVYAQTLHSELSNLQQNSDAASSLPTQEDSEEV